MSKQALLESGSSGFGKESFLEFCFTLPAWYLLCSLISMTLGAYFADFNQNLSIPIAIFILFFHISMARLVASYRNEGEFSAVIFYTVYVLALNSILYWLYPKGSFVVYGMMALGALTIPCAFIRHGVHFKTKQAKASESLKEPCVIGFAVNASGKKTNEVSMREMSGHWLLNGKTGSGKTTMLCHLAIQYIKAGYRVIYATNSDTKEPLQYLAPYLRPDGYSIMFFNGIHALDQRQAHYPHIVIGQVNFKYWESALYLEVAQFVELSDKPCLVVLDCIDAMLPGGNPTPDVKSLYEICGKHNCVVAISTEVVDLDHELQNYIYQTSEKVLKFGCPHGYNGPYSEQRKTLKTGQFRELSSGQIFQIDELPKINADDI